ncbi:MAG TPA: CBS domain-containing protein [Candidatus Micrarchaeaceae archaeon]|nr:CBS domain-containing protein [Candidatus Micrarchaeaceae archaeon]
MKVTEIMSQPVVTVTPGTGIKAAAELLVEHGISALPVVDSAGQLVGIVSEADLIAIEARPDPRSQATPLGPTAGSTPRSVAEVMTRDVVVVTTQSEVAEAAKTMLSSDVKRVPVMSGRRVVGIVSRRDLVKVIARTDSRIEAEVNNRLDELGLATAGSIVKVTDGVATVPVEREGTARRLMESAVLQVAGVLEVRFAEPAPNARADTPTTRSGAHEVT